MFISSFMKNKKSKTIKIIRRNVKKKKNMNEKIFRKSHGLYKKKRKNNFSSSDGNLHDGKKKEKKKRTSVITVRERIENKIEQIF